MSSAGNLLQTARLAQNRTLRDIASETCINERYLRAIEADDQSALPGDFFYRSFIRQYATALSLDEQTTSAILCEVAPAKEVDPLPRLTLAYETALTEGRLSGLYRPRTAAAVALLALVLIGCSGLYAIWHRSQVQKEITAEPAPLHSANVEAAPSAVDNKAER
jgi:cytoskeletal protein RodZ